VAGRLLLAVERDAVGRVGVDLEAVDGRVEPELAVDVALLELVLALEVDERVRLVAKGKGSRKRSAAYVKSLVTHALNFQAEDKDNIASTPAAIVDAVLIALAEAQLTKDMQAKTIAQKVRCERELDLSLLHEKGWVARKMPKGSSGTAVIKLEQD